MPVLHLKNALARIAIIGDLLGATVAVLQKPSVVVLVAANFPLQLRAAWKREVKEMTLITPRIYVRYLVYCDVAGTDFATQDLHSSIPNHN